MPQWVIEKVRAKAQRFKQPVIGFLGVTFKADIDPQVIRHKVVIDTRGVLLLSSLAASAAQPMRLLNRWKARR